MASRVSRNSKDLPTIQPQIMRGFEAFLPRYLRKHFHSLAVNCDALLGYPIQPDAALVVYANHPSWWDPLIAFYLRQRLFRDFRLYAPIDAQALSRYRIFSKMGFYGIESDSLRGAQEFLRRSKRILIDQGASIWITPEGRFCDPRDHTASLMPGLSHLAYAIERWNDAVPGSSQVWFIPVAFEITFWEERLPECLCWFGTPRAVRWGTKTMESKADWNDHLTTSLRATQNQLAKASTSRACESFEVLLSGHAGTWSLYDVVRRMVWRFRGQPIRLEHGSKLSRLGRHAEQSGEEPQAK